MRESMIHGLEDREIQMFTRAVWCRERMGGGCRDLHLDRGLTLDFRADLWRSVAYAMGFGCVEGCG